MKLIVLITLCMWGECENYMITEPYFTNIKECNEYSISILDRSLREFSESSGFSFCVTENEALDIFKNLIINNI